MFYFIVYLLLFPLLFCLSFFRKKSDKNLVIQTAKIGDYANSSIIFDSIKPFDIVLDDANLEFANYDNRICQKFAIKKYKKSIFLKLNLGFRLFLINYNNVYVLTPNALNLFLAKITFSKNFITISHKNQSTAFKFLAKKATQIYHDTDTLSLISYLRMINLAPDDFKFSNEDRSLNLAFKKQIQAPIFIPKDIKIKSDKFKIGISFTAGNKIKTPPKETWDKIFKIISKFDAEAYIFGVKNDALALDNIDTNGVKIVNLVDKIPLKELPFYTSNMHLYISSDTGNYYIADTMEVPTISLMGPCFASEQRGVFNSLIITSNLAPISSVFKTARDIDATNFFLISKNDEEKIESFIKELVDDFLKS